MILKDRVAVITGSGQGLGKAYAKTLAEHGAKVVIAEINAEKAESVAQELRDQHLEAISVQVDVSNEESTKRMADEVIKQWGKVDILINNAAYFSTIQMKPFEEISIEEWDRAMAINLRGAFLSCRAIVPHMKQRRSGTIVNVTSATVLEGRPYYLHYVTSKAGIIGFTRALAREIGEFGINVNTLSPGLTLTDVPRTTINDAAIKGAISRQSIRRSGVSEDMSGVILFLVSDQAKFVSGQMLNVDGGSSMH
ncbi:MULTISPECIES: 3-oxoacyl-ACP reductase family protein [unclassified Paenibacillus]|uniref:SDR family NAD(P)-dependent oxidoreductase n=1 Tax=unclassified Paenibacillus TaxID=185978 RepID=UPI001AE27182|nr:MULTISPECIES: 3-oxoacyl-ACP reductase family protein [unclassified Paenibacillus]MBP1153759.1 3-oxoacyl-[acyl-carrier protein] reductase [Paenibacillus sp. PvP091]MBP1170856.1 3-oxoacyl-[acyl-carrier protein] reductase [Paenibacillus sp. PvR098]MBP2441884.1 3-oxoacyl-[acyl-carrier protein] reductase [Paenibacillus sp. PvP052]